MSEDGMDNIADAIMELARSIDAASKNLGFSFNGIERSLRSLGTNAAASDIGAVELMAKEIKNGCERIQDGIGFVSQSIGDSNMRDKNDEDKLNLLGDLGGNISSLAESAEIAVSELKKRTV